MLKLAEIAIIVVLLVLSYGGVERDSSSAALGTNYTSAEQQLAQRVITPLQRRVPVSYQEGGVLLSDIRATDKDNLWAVGHKRTPDIPVTESFVVHSSNGGRTWEKQLTDQGHFFFNVYFINPEVGWVCGADGLILKTIRRRREMD